MSDGAYCHYCHQAKCICGTHYVKVALGQDAAKMRKLVKALRKEARIALAQRTSDIYETKQHVYSKLTVAERRAIKRWLIAGTYAYALQSVARRITRRLK